MDKTTENPSINAICRVGLHFAHLTGRLAKICPAKHIGLIEDMRQSCLEKIIVHLFQGRKINYFLFLK